MEFRFHGGSIRDINILSVFCAYYLSNIECISFCKIIDEFLIFCGGTNLLCEKNIYIFFAAANLLFAKTCELQFFLFLFSNC